MPTNTNRRTSNNKSSRRFNSNNPRYGFSGRGTTSTWTTGSGFFGGNTTSRRTTSNNRSTIASGNPAPGYRQVFSTFEQKINSFRTLATQACGQAPSGRPTPTTLNTFANWINKGAIINRVTPSQIGRWTGKRTQKFNTAGAAKNALASCFGQSVIKAVTCDKNGNFLVATAATSKGRNFRFPNR